MTELKISLAPYIIASVMQHYSALHYMYLPPYRNRDAYILTVNPHPEGKAVVGIKKIVLEGEQIVIKSANAVVTHISPFETVQLLREKESRLRQLPAISISSIRKVLGL